MQTLWERSRHAFDRILQDGEKAAERVIGSFEELGDAGRARFEKARLERALFKRFAELGNRVYELHRDREGEAAGAASVLDDPQVKPLLDQVAGLDQNLKRIENQLERR